MKHYPYHPHFDTKENPFWLTRAGIMYKPCEFNKHECHENELLTAMAYIKFSCKKLRGVSRSGSSYGFKHHAENWGKRFNKFLNKDIFSSYVSNGVFILAAIKCGIRIYPIENSYNCFFNLTTGSHSVLSHS